MRALRQITLLAAGLIFLVPALAPSPASAQAPSASAADAQKDPVLKAMLAELDRSRQQLQLPGFQKPFFIQYVVDDMDSYNAYATFGAFCLDQEHHRRIVRVTVRVGDYKTDSSSTGRAADGATQFAAYEDDPTALRYALWSATDTAYKAALNAYTQKQAALKAVQTPPSADDFSQQKAVISLGPIATSGLDRRLWIDRVAAATALYRTGAGAATPRIEDTSGQIASRVLNRYIVNTDGTIVRKGSSEYLAEVTIGAQASDGMRLERAYSTVAPVADQLDSAEKFRAGVLGILGSIHDLAAAPVVADDYHGPVLFSGDASSDIFARLFAPAIAASRPGLGTTARTLGAYGSAYQTRVLPEFLNVVDDPSLASFEGHALLGSYTIDDEGVPAQAVTLVDQGKLVNYVIGRQPVKDFPVSNGHGRAGAGDAPRPEAAVLHVEAARPISSEALTQKLLATGKDQGLDAVYAVETFGAGFAPRLLYKIDVATSKRQLVRGATLADLDQRSLRSGIRAAGDQTYVDNIFGDPGATVLAPALLIDDITVKRAEQRNEKLPYYPPPD